MSRLHPMPCLALLAAAPLCPGAAAQEPPATFQWARAAWSEFPERYVDYAFRVTAMPNGDSVTFGQHLFPITFGAGEPNETTLSAPGPYSPWDYGTYLARHAADGALVWVKGIRGSQLPLNVAAFPDGSLLAVSDYWGPVTLGAGEAHETTLQEDPSRDYNGYVARLNADGSLAWAWRLDGDAEPVGAATFADGSFAICGDFRGVATFGAGAQQVALSTTSGATAFVAKYAADGSLLFARAAVDGLTFGYGSVAWSVGALADGSCAIAGGFGMGGVALESVTFGGGEPNETTLVSAGQGDAFVARFLADGSCAWARSAGSPGSDYAEDLAVGADGSVAITGSGPNVTLVGMTFGGGTPQAVTLPVDESLFIASYDVAGALNWARGATQSQGWGVASFPDGSWIVSGGAGNGARFGTGELAETTLPVAGRGCVARYLADGTLAWAAPAYVFPGTPGYGNGFAQGAAAFPDGTFFTVGAFEDRALFGAGQASEQLLSGAPYVEIDPSYGFYPTASWFARYRAFAPNAAPVGPDATSATVMATTPGGDSTSVALSFDQVLSPGVTTVTTAASGQALPSGFQLGSEPVWYDVSTSATFSGPIELCFAWSEGQFANEGNIALLHYENGAWVDTTTSLDTEANVVCGLVASLSPFALVEVEYLFDGFEPPVAPDGSSIFRAGRVVPLKFRLEGPGGAPVSDADATLRLYHLTSTVLGSVEVAVESPGAANTGTAFRWDGPTGRYVYNLATAGLPTGTYRADALLDDGSTHSVQFSLR